MPSRIQLQRVAGWRLPPNCVKVDRATMWGNPFTVDDALEMGLATTRPEAVEVCVAYHRLWLDGNMWLRDTYSTAVGGRAYDRRDVLARLGDLAGRDLACWCPVADVDGESADGIVIVRSPCHADNLLALANREVS